MKKCKIAIDSWVPADSIVLEANAMTVAKSSENFLVIAGPGAGKSELLAQRACFLLETNQCAFPKRILAISFKRDAAHNLRLRVQKRVGNELARRFTSMTFDSFAKSIVDRFRMGIPEEYRPDQGYEILTDSFPAIAKDAFGDALVAMGEVENKSKIYWKGFGNPMYRLSNRQYPIPEGEAELEILVMQSLLGSKPSKVTFPILARLAQLALVSNPKLLNHLRQTYSHVFLDEFQDTTNLQFDLLRTAFEGSESVLTAVGDFKQRIMLWAGAMEGIFESYNQVFGAEFLPLQMNFRSAPRLVALQNHFAGTLMGNQTNAMPPVHKAETEGVAEFWAFGDEKQEAIHLAQFVDELIRLKGLAPRDICFLFKQQAEHYSKELIAQLQHAGYQARVENEYQDFLVEPLIVFVRNLVKCMVDPGDVAAREFLLLEYAKLESIEDERALLKREMTLLRNLKELRNAVQSAANWQAIYNCLSNEIKATGYKKFKAVYDQYNRTFFNKMLLSFLEKLNDGFNNTGNLGSALSYVEGEGAIPIMTIHKSKGLEFEVVFLVGFEDQNFWSFKSQSKEDICAFFVALSRAKQAIYFTFSKWRDNPNRGNEVRSLTDIRKVFDTLIEGGILEFKNFTPKP